VSEDSSENTWTLVTGASSGTGLAFARELARRGHRVLAVARRRDRLEALAREAAEQGGSIVPLVADLQTGEGLGVVVERMGGLGTIDLLVNNAGIATFGDFQHSSLEQELGAIRLNVHAVLTLTHAVLGEMLKRRRGAIINVASLVAFQPFPHFAVYAASKAFVLSFSEALAEAATAAVRPALAKVLADSLHSPRNNPSRFGFPYCWQRWEFVGFLGALACLIFRFHKVPSLWRWSNAKMRS
jgi:short-subunit dehydrogenase